MFSLGLVLHRLFTNKEFMEDVFDRHLLQWIMDSLTIAEGPHKNEEVQVVQKSKFPTLRDVLGYFVIAQNEMVVSDLEVRRQGGMVIRISSAGLRVDFDKVLALWKAEHNRRVADVRHYHSFLNDVDDTQMFVFKTVLQKMLSWDSSLRESAQVLLDELGGKTYKSMHWIKTLPRSPPRPSFVQYKSWHFPKDWHLAQYEFLTGKMNWRTTPRAASLSETNLGPERSYIEKTPRRVAEAGDALRHIVEDPHIKELHWNTPSNKARFVEYIEEMNKRSFRGDDFEHDSYLQKKWESTISPPAIDMVRHQKSKPSEKIVISLSV